MGTKLRNNKYVLGGTLVLLIYLLSFSLFLISDVYKNRSFLNTEAYFNSDKFKTELDVFSRNYMSLYVEYKDFDKKPDNEKVIDSEVSNELALNESYITNKQQEVTNDYYNLIREAQSRGDYDTVKKLNEELTKKTEDIKNKNSKTLDEIKIEMIKWKTKDYENIKNSVMQDTCIKYYIRNKNTNGIYTNINEVTSNGGDYFKDINNYIKENALYSIRIPVNLKEDSYSYSTDFFNNDSVDGYIIIPKDIDKNSYIHKGYEYYNSIRSRLLKEQIMLFAVISIIAALFVYLLYNKKNLNNIIPIKKMFLLIEKIALYIKIAILCILTLIVFFYLDSISFFYMPIDSKHFLRLTLLSVVIIVFVLISVNIVLIIGNKARFKQQIRLTVLANFLQSIKYGLKYKKNLLKLMAIFVTTVVFGIYINVFWRYYNPLLLIYSITYILIIPIYILRTFLNFCKIAHGTDEITSGNLNYEIDISGKSIMAKLASNINNMKLGFKMALEEQVKSERLKSELITNVSHDLKTPLTSIINYVDLLKDEDVTDQERINYISILDKKSQRLKVLIEDLFEASKLSSGNIEMNIEKIDVSSLLKQALGELNHKIEESNLIFKINIPKEKIYSNLDGKRTWRVFDNLINNALKYSQANTRVYIDLEEQEENIVFIIKNISAYELDFNAEEIFERFKRGDSSRSTEGSGLGLAIAKSIVELEQGSIDINIDGDLFKVIVKFKKIKS